MHKYPPIISIVGKKNAGKTTFIERIIPELKRYGYKVGTIKHDAHNFEIDIKGKDSYRHFHAGADVSIIASSEKIGITLRPDFEPTPADLRQRFFKGIDIILCEGYKRYDLPKIEITSSSEINDLIFKDDKHLAGVVINKVNGNLPSPRFSKWAVGGIPEERIRVFTFNQIIEITTWLKEGYL